MSKQLGFFGDEPTHAKRDAMVRNAELSECGTWRWWLSRQWDDELPMGLVCMLNPSTADHQQDDPTIQSLIRRARHWRWGGFYVVNLCAFRSPHPEDLPKAKDPIGPENDATVSALAERVASGGGRMVAAWGAFSFKDARPEIRGRDDAILRTLCEFGEVFCIGRAQDGSPKHPMARGKHRVPDDAPLEPFASSGATVKAKQREIKPFSALPPSPLDVPPAGSAPKGPCSFCGTPAEGHYGVQAQDNSRTLPLCDKCGPSYHPTIREVWARVAEGIGS